MPPGPPMPGLRDRVPTPHAQPAVGARVQAASAAPARVPPAATAARVPQASPGAPMAASRPPAAAAPPVRRPVAPRPGQAEQEPVTPAPASRSAPSDVTPPPRNPAGVPRHATPAQGFEIKPPPAQARMPLPPPPSKAPAPADDLPALVPPGAAVEGARQARTRASKTRPVGPPAIRGASAVTADKPPSVFNTTSGEIRRQKTPVHGIDSHAATVELPRDMQDPAALINTPEPMSGSMLVEEPPSKLPVAQAPHPANQGVRPSDRLSAFTSVHNNDFGGDTDKNIAPAGKRRSGRGIGRWPLVVHIVLGIILGVGIVVAYSVFHGLPMSLP